MPKGRKKKPVGLLLKYPTLLSTGGVELYIKYPKNAPKTSSQ